MTTSQFLYAAVVGVLFAMSFSALVVGVWLLVQDRRRARQDAERMLARVNEGKP